MKHSYLFLKVVLILLSFYARAQTPDGAGIVYVTPDGNGDGSSWGSPTSNLHNAINADGAKKVFVAVGTYKTGAHSFVMKNGVEIYGGFIPGSSITDLSHNRILPNKGMGDGSVLDADNERPVIWNDMPERGQSPMDGTAVLDGFTITKGAYSGHGAGIRNINASPVLRNLVIKNNKTGYPGQGAGIYNYNSSPKISNVSITQNNASLNGGGMYNDMGSSPVLTHVSITGNEASYQGGGLYNDMNCNPTLINVKVTDNQSYRGTSDAGGGIFHAHGASTYINVTFANNFPVDVRLYDGTILFKNSIVSGGLQRGISATYTAEYSLINGNTDLSEGNINAADYLATQIFNNPSNGDYSLKSGSPAIDAGSNALFTGLDAHTGDLAGNPRVHNYSTNGIIDMGAYESPFKAPIVPDANGIVYVTQSGGGNGSSWARPTADLQGAIDATGTQKVFVATGTYHHSRSFVMKNNVEIYGGFDPGSGITDLSHSRILPSPTVQGSVLDGQDSRQVIANYMNGVTPLAVLDGFTLTRGSAYGSGGAIQNFHASPTLRNLVITGNRAIEPGAGIANESSSPVLMNVIIYGNSGRAIHNYLSDATLTNVLIYGNSNYPYSGIYHTAGTLTLTNVTVVDDVYFETGSTWKNCIVYGNFDGAGAAPSFLFNSLIKGNTNTINGNLDATNITLNDIFTDPSAGDYTLKIYSPAINAGQNSHFTGLNANTKDVAGNARVYRFDNGGVIDLGAYESSHMPLAPTNGIIYVKTGATGERDGTSWDNATDNLHKAIHTNGVQKVFVAVGEYPAGTSSFVMKNGVEIYGGFDPGSGITGLEHQRIMPDPSNTQGSLLNGQGERPVIWNVFTSGTAMDRTAVLDGFTIYNGAHADGAGIRNIYASPTLRNLVIRGNQASTSGAGIFNNFSSPLISNTVISDNTVTNALTNVSGAGIFNNNNSAPEIINTTITGNKLVVTSTGGMYGAGIFNGGGSAAKIYNSIIWNNQKNGDEAASGADIENSDSGITLKNSITRSFTTGNDADNNKVNANPVFTGSGFRLQTGSPAINAGSNAWFEGLNAGTRDLEGNPRVSSQSIDMGAYEYTLSPDGNGIIYVRQGYTGKGSSWADATGDLHNAIHADGVQKVFVAAGTYKTGAHSFIMKNGVEIYGGFDPDNGVTDLSHHRILPNRGMGDGSVLDGEGQRTVIWNVFDAASPVNHTAVLDGFSIINGRYSGGYGGGINNVYASPVLRNLVIRNNLAERGGGIANTNSSPETTYTIISSNRAGNYGYGGGVYNTTGSSPRFMNCLITNNETFEPSTFATFGGGMWTTDDSHALLINVTITKNRVLGNSISAGGGLGVAGDASTTLHNCIVWDNEKSKSTTQGGADLAAWATMTISHSMTQVHSTGNSADHNLVGVDPLFTNPADGNFSLQNASPAINRGSNALFTGLDGDTKDLAGSARVYNYNAGGVIDMGAYESPFDGGVTPDANGIVYVREGFSGNGENWERATGDLKKAIEATGTQKVFVATGNYNAPANGSFKMKNSVEIYGGFDPDNGIRTLADTRILPTETTGGSVLNGQNLRGVIRNDYTSADMLTSSAILDGFTITNGETAGNTFGAGVLNVFASPTLRNLVIKNNKHAAGGGAGMANISASPVISNVIITRNEALRGGGIYNVDNSAPVLTDVIISHNKATSDSQFGGGGIFSQRSSPTLTRVTISHNTAGNTGGGIYAINSPAILATHSIIEHNTAPYGGGVYSNSSESQFVNVIFRGNSATMATTGSGGGALFNQNSVLRLTNVAVVGNSTNFQGGGLRNLSGNPILTNVTFVNNTATDATSTAIDIAGGTPEFYNSLVFGTVKGGYTAQHSLIRGNTDFNNGNIDASGITPVNVFTDPANGDYSLLACSPAVNSGSNSLFPGLDISKTDLAGNARVYDFANGKNIDMGAYELQEAPTDYSAMTFANSTVVYNGNPHSITVQNVVQGASVTYEITNSDNQTSQGNAATAAGTYQVTATITPVGNCLSIKRTATLKINKAAAVITAVKTQKHVYDGTVKNVIASLNHTEIPINYSPQQGYTAIGTYPVILSVAETGNYLEITDTVSLVIEKAKLSGITLRDSAFTYDGTAKSLAVSGLPADATVSYGNNGKINAGIYTVTATISRPNYQDSLLTATLTIHKAAAVITAALTQKHVYDGTVKNVIASLNHTEAPLNYSPQQGYTAIGTYPIIVSAPATTNYLEIADTVSLVIEKAKLSDITLRDSAFTYDGTAKSLAVSGLPADATVSYGNNGKINAGIYTVTATISRPNYQDSLLTATLTIHKAAAVITAAPTQKHIYDGSVKNVTAVLNHTEATLAYSPQHGYTAAGTYPVIISAAETDNYLKVADTVSLVIEKANMSGIAFRDSSFTYDGTPKSLAVSGLPAGATVVYSGNARTNAGIYSVNATVSRPNYQDSLLTATLTIHKAAAVITAVQTQTHVYDGTAKNVAASLSHTETALTYSPQLGYTTAGTYPVIISAAETANYLKVADTVSLVIEKAKLAGITFRDSSFTYDGTPKFLAVSGLPAGATASYDNNEKINAGIYTVTATVSRPNYLDSVLSATLTIRKAAAVITAVKTQKHVFDGTVKNITASLNHTDASLTYAPQQGYSAVGTYPVIISAAETANYLKVADTVSLVIEKARLSGIAFRDSTFIYDGTPKSLAATGLPAGATVVYSGNDRTHAGTYSVTATVSRPNYQDSLLTATLTIRKAAAVITAAQTQKHVFDGTIKNVTASLNHTDVSLTYAPQQGYSAVGVYPVIISAAETANYLKTADTVSLEIAKAGLSGIAFRDSAFTYDGTPRSLAVSGLPTGATVTYSGNARTNAGTYSVTATVSRPNYKDSLLIATLTIHKAAAVITAAQTQKHVFDGTVKNVSASLNHTETALTYSPQQGYSAVGIYPVTVSAAATANYLAASGTVSLEITKASLSGITFPDASFTYDGTPRSLAVSGLPTGATVAYSGNARTDAGIYSVTATVSRPNYQDSLLTATLTIRKAASVITATDRQEHTVDGSLKMVVAALNHQEATLSYSPQQGYTLPGTYTITVSVPESKNYLAASRKVTLLIHKATFQGVGFAGNEFTYDGSQHFVYVWGTPEGTRITYFGNGQVSAGSYSVRALIQKENYHDLELYATLTIHKAQAYISTGAYQAHVYDGSVKNVQAWLNHAETALAYHPQQGYVDAGSYSVTVIAPETQNYLSTSASVNLFIDKARFQGVTLAGKEFTYNGSPHALAVSGAPEGAQVTYTGNNQVNAGTYKVTALVQMKNYYDLELEADLIIHKAPQTISFGEIPVTHLENDTDFQLQATSSSELPVNYSFTYQAEEPPATVTEQGWVELHTSGYVSITAHQPGNENYLPAEPVIRILKIISSDATIHRISLGGEIFETPASEIYYLMDCADDRDQITLLLKTEVGAYVVPGRSLTIDIPKPGIYTQTVVITSQDSTNTLTYHITIEKRFKFENIGVQKFNNLFLVNNNPQTNGGYEFTEYEWLKNGEVIGTGQYYSAGNQSSDILDQGAVYTVRMKTKEGQWLSSCGFGFLPDASFTIGIFPNPLRAGDVLKVKVSDPAEARVSILTLTGQPVLQTFIKAGSGEIKLPSQISAGSYILHYENEKHRRSLPFILEK